MREFFPLLNVLGAMLTIFSVTFLLPITTSLIYQDNAAPAFSYAMSICLIAGSISWLATLRFKAELKARDGFLLVTLAWTLMSLIGSMPLMFVYENMSFTDAFFESMSGLTTTGATVMTNLDHAPPSINLWRHELNWLGGMGIIVLAIAILPLLGVGGMQLFRAETPGPMKDAKLTARISDTARALWLVYLALTIACALCLRLAGMSWFDAICHAFACLGLGGFSTRDASIGAFNSPAIEAVLIVFMVIAALNFATHFVAWKSKSLKAYWNDVEAKGIVILLGISCIGSALYLWKVDYYPSFWTALRHASFNLVSVATDCGFASVDFDKWPAFVPLWMLFLSCILASSGSTGGGIKMIRTLILASQGARELTRLLHPAVVNPVIIGGAIVPNRVVFAVLGFIFLYFMSIVTLTFLLMFGGLDFISAFSAVIACINNAGPGLNVVGPAQNYGPLTDFETWVLSFTMLLGRLEVFSLLILFTPGFWRK
jgi:trk system potassium uptake protein